MARGLFYCLGSHHCDSHFYAFLLQEKEMVLRGVALIGENKQGENKSFLGLNQIFLGQL